MGDGSGMTRSPRGQLGGCKEQLGCSGCWVQRGQSARTRKALVWCHHHLEVSLCLGGLCQDRPGKSEPVFPSPDCPPPGQLVTQSWPSSAVGRPLLALGPGPGREMAAHAGGCSYPLPSCWESSRTLLEGGSGLTTAGMTVGAKFPRWCSHPGDRWDPGCLLCLAPRSAHPQPHFLCRFQVR